MPGISPTSSRRTTQAPRPDYARGLAEMFTVARLGIDGRLAKTLTSSNRSSR
jgi:hypothetical protein